MPRHCSSFADRSTFGGVSTSAHASPHPLVTRRPLPNGNNSVWLFLRPLTSEVRLLLKVPAREKSTFHTGSCLVLPAQVHLRTLWWDLSGLRVRQFQVAGDSSGKDKRMGGKRQHSALKQAIYGSPGLYSTAPAMDHDSAAHGSTCGSQGNCSVFCKHTPGQ